MAVGFPTANWREMRPGGADLSLRSHPADRLSDDYVGIQRFTLYRYR